MLQLPATVQDAKCAGNSCAPLVCNRLTCACINTMHAYTQCSATGCHPNPAVFYHPAHTSPGQIPAIPCGTWTS